MCGIAGLIDTRRRMDDDALRATAVAMARPLAHRGPDASGVWSDAHAGVGVGHQRLAIIDLSSAGHQPMRSLDGRWTVVFNGEIYNFRQLRDRLSAAGVRFEGGSDTEVLVEACAAWGVGEAVRAANGMFAFAAYDAATRTLHLVRDRLGEKPLYYGMRGGTLAFASELGSFAALPEFDGAVDQRAVAEFLRLGYVPAPLSIYRGVSKLPPGCLLSVPADASALPDPQPYWSLDDVVLRGLDQPFPGDERDATDELEVLLRDAVSLRMVADVPLGAFLSGGVDSSLVTALMQAQSSRPVRTFTIGFDDPALDEASHAKAVAAHLGTDHTETYLRPDDALDRVPSLAAMYDEPFADPSALPTALVAEVARRHVTVGMSGDGGDEVFAGYNRYTMGGAAWRRMQRWPAPLRASAAALLRAAPPRMWDSLVRTAGSVAGRAVPSQAGTKAQKLASVLGATDEDDLYRRMVDLWERPAAMAGLDAVPNGSAPAPIRSIPELLMYRDAKVVLPDNMLVKVDRATMAVSMEARVPLLDHRVVEFAWALPTPFKIVGSEGKRPLKSVLHRYVPRELVERPKTGFDPPIAEWLRGPLRGWAEDLLASSQLAGAVYMDPVRASWVAHQRGRRNHDYALWAVLMLSSWLQNRPLRAGAQS